MIRSKRLAIDFDGTICDIKYPECGKLKKGVKKALKQLQSDGFIIIIYSCRSNKRIKHTEKTMINYLKKHKVPYDSIECGYKGKPLVDFYIDDMAIQYSDKVGWNRLVRVIRKLYKGV